MNTPTAEIEPAATDEIDAVAELWVRLARDQRQHDSDVRAETNRETMRETLAAHAANDGLLVARVDGSLVGFASFAIERGALDLDVTRGTLTNLYVEPGYRGCGIGTALLERAEATLADRGVDTMILEVMADNEAGRRFYRDHGYETFRVTMGRSLEKRSKNDTHSKEER